MAEDGASEAGLEHEARLGVACTSNAQSRVTGPPAALDTDVRGSGRGRKWMDETYLSTQRAQARQDTRLSQAHVDQSWTGRDQGPPGEGTPAPVGLTPMGPAGSERITVVPIRSRHTFAALRRPSGKGRHGPVSMSFVDRPDWTRTEVAYAVNRKVGNAVQRNLLRRRMRAIVSERAAVLPVGAYLVRVGPDGTSLDFNELKVAMTRAFEKATSRMSPVKGSVQREANGASQ